MLKYEPSQRISAKMSLSHPYFTGVCKQRPPQIFKWEKVLILPTLPVKVMCSNTWLWYTKKCMQDTCSHFTFNVFIGKADVAKTSLAPVIIIFIFLKNEILPLII